ncbi:hypothetical protein J6590_020428 [Homalodisca vitripennis]|nr:hypothetical protein J6590_020428 [Homalodisca vitripennis]
MGPSKLSSRSRLKAAIHVPASRTVLPEQSAGLWRWTDLTIHASRSPHTLRPPVSGGLFRQDCPTCLYVYGGL